MLLYDNNKIMLRFACRANKNNHKFNYFRLYESIYRYYNSQTITITNILNYSLKIKPRNIWVLY